METLNRIANKARMRMQFNVTVSNSIHWFLYVCCGVLLLAIIDRVGATPLFPWNIVLLIAGVGGIFILILEWTANSFSTVEAAYELDDRMQLHDRISSALASKDIDTPFSKVVLEDALQIVESKQVVASMPKHFPIVLPKRFNWVLGVIAATVMVLWTPQWGFFQSDNNTSLASAVIASKENIETSIDAVLEELQSDKELNEALEEELAELAATTQNNVVDPETMRRDALRKMTHLQKRLDEMLQDENALAFEEMLRRMQQLKLPKSGNTVPMVAALKNGNFDKAKKEFDTLQEKMESATLTEQERKELEKQLEALSEQLNKLSDLNESLASALSAAGMNSALAKNAEAAGKAIKNAKNLNAEQKQKLLKMLEAQQLANKMCEKMSEGCKQCAGGKSGMPTISELEKMQAMQSFKTKAQMAKSACKQAGANMSATGGEGKGNGGSNPTTETESTMVAQRTAVSTLDGTIIAKQLFEGGMLTAGESTSEVKDTVLAQRIAAEQAITDEEIPRKYHDLLRHYFGKLEEMTETSTNDDTDNND